MMRWENTQRGFTVVELLIVVVVIAILAAITIVSFNGIQTKTRDSSRDAAARSIRHALEQYKIDNNDQYPLCSGGSLNIGYNSTCLASLLVPKYLSSIPRDPSSSVTIDFVTGNGQLSYGLLVRYESKPACKYIVGSTANSGWWGASYPVC